MIPPDHHHAGAALRERHAGLETDAARGAGHENCLAADVPGHQGRLGSSPRSPRNAQIAAKLARFCSLLKSPCPPFSIVTSRFATPAFCSASWRRTACEYGTRASASPWIDKTGGAPERTMDSGETARASS